MYIAYLVNDAGDLAGGLRVIVEHVNHLKSLGNNVEIWNKSGATITYFESDVDIKPFDPSALNLPDALVMTDLIFLSEVMQYRSRPATYLLLQHDNEWVSEVANTTTYASMIGSNIDYFKEGKCTILVVSSWLKNLVRDRYNLESVLIMNGVNNSLFHPIRPLLQYETPSIIIFYDPQPWKGFYEAVLAIAELRKQMPDLEVLVIGKYIFEVPKVDNVAFAFPFPIIFFNRPPQKNLAKIISSASIHLSTSWKEGFGLPGLESLACGVPLVTSNSLGNEDYAIHNKTALVVADNNPSSYTESMLALLTDKDLHHRLRANGIQKAKEFSWPKSIGILEKLMQRDIMKE
jgi:glycosyltransferase involved in cell wall biosynthesis